MRNKASFHIEDASLCKQQMLSWINRFSICCFMDSHDYKHAYSVYDCLAAAGAASVCLPEQNKLSSLQAFTQQNKDWLFGHVGYDLKNEIEHLSSRHKDSLQFPDLFFFQPEVVLYIQGNELSIESLHCAAEDIYSEIVNQNVNPKPSAAARITIKERISKETYTAIIDKIKEHIKRGDCYEINFCQEFFAENAFIHPLLVYNQLTVVSPSPFSAYYKLNDKYALCASPERFIQKRGERLVSQPMKGTAKRILEDAILDKQAKETLQSSAKDRTENVMIADLVRNDMSRVSLRNSVKVVELFGVYTYARVHQMITTIEGKTSRQINVADVLKTMFPMGSMTGAPKKKVMELIEEFEQSKRGLYSGCMGYITPDNDWDFNVVIRSILYNETHRYLSFHVGSAITWGSNAEDEYDECIVKAEAMSKVLE